MSGYGPATDDSGNILFVTGNSDYSGTTYDGVSNLQERRGESFFRPDQRARPVRASNRANLDQCDADFGSGGVMVLPDQPGPKPHLAVAAGKVGECSC